MPQHDYLFFNVSGLCVQYCLLLETLCIAVTLNTLFLKGRFRLKAHFEGGDGVPGKAAVRFALLGD